MSEEMKPCPFCQDGGKLFINGGVGCRWVECSSCGCDGPAYETEAEAIEAWNTRAERTCRYESTDRCTWVCTSCGREVETLHLGYNYCPNCGAKVIGQKVIEH